MLVLGIESSCDDTAVAILNEQKEVYRSKIFSQAIIHKNFGGVVPEIAARKHLELFPYLIMNVLIESGLNIEEIDLVSVTKEPGLKNSLLVGLMYAKTIASLINKKFITINHLEGHMLSSNINNKCVKYPCLILLISGGHCEIIFAEKIGKYKVISRTMDDSIGELFDKVAKILNLGYPGGPIIEKYAKYGYINKIKVKNRTSKKMRNFSFSGVKTYIIQEINKFKRLKKESIFNICASVQNIAAEIINQKVIKLLILFSSKYNRSNQILISGGVASNSYIKKMVHKNVKALGYKLYFPTKELCTDNAVMIAYTGMKKISNNTYNNLNFDIKKR